jgi:NDP-sugar pyrophosphorylase family protein
MQILDDSTELLPIPPISLLAEDSSNSNVVAIHPTALIEAGAIIGKGTTIGPYCIIDRNVVIGDNCKLVAHVHVTGRTTIGPRTVISPFASLGAPPQSVSFRGGVTRLVRAGSCSGMASSAADRESAIYQALRATPEQQRRAELEMLSA